MISAEQKDTGGHPGDGAGVAYTTVTPHGGQVHGSAGTHGQLNDGTDQRHDGHAHTLYRAAVHKKLAQKKVKGHVT